ncbi:MAG: hypothetical protein FWG28_07190 [Clostridiales bacterium]|nr:hypothetical protein [Clostridiales bacterium]
MSEKVCSQFGLDETEAGGDMGNCNGHITGFPVEDDMRFTYMNDGQRGTKPDAEAELALAVAGEAFVPDRAWIYETHARFRIGNMAFVDIHQTPTGDVRDVNMQPFYVVVVLGDEPRLVRMPDQELFARFMTVVRADPGLMTLTQRLMAALILAIGGDGECIRESGFEPTWTDEDGVLVIRCHRVIRSNQGRTPPVRVVSTLTVDEKQNLSLHEAPAPREGFRS